MDLETALEWLESHVNLEATDDLDVGRQVAARSLERMRGLVAMLGDPQLDLAAIHITGTNGKGSVARMATALLVAQGLSVGTYTSPDLEQVNERLAWNGEAASDEELAAALAVVALAEQATGERASRFEVLTAAALRWFGDLAVEGAVVEVGLGGRWDATNVVEPGVAVVTNVDLDHTAYLGNTRQEIAAEKAGIFKRGAVVVVGEADPVIVAQLSEAAATAGAERVLVRDTDFGCERNLLAVGGRLLDLRTPGGAYDEVYLAMHGRHQGDNAAVALAATEAFLGFPLDLAVVESAFAVVDNPGRVEVVGRAPLVVLDGAHNPAGAATLATTLDEEFPVAGERVLVVGLLRGRDAGEMLRALAATRARLVIACEPPSPRAMPAREVVAAATALGVAAVEEAEPAAAVQRALAEVSEDDMVVVAGSLYVVGAVRAALAGREPR